MNSRTLFVDTRSSGSRPHLYVMNFDVTRKKKNPVAPATTIAEDIFNDVAPLSSDVGASALSASLATGPNALGGLDLLVVGVGELASLLGAGGDEGSSVGDSARGDESEGGEVADGESCSCNADNEMQEPT
ncbi:Uncharacterized protein Fot_12285 [Forsythia ovata]|uniref:Uncharacterized protein n=1 Tax=Forsythia ovata TaxID=205694 RepID=A0ABD1WM33_9LAMI